MSSMHITIRHADISHDTSMPEYLFVFIMQKSCILFSFIRVACKKSHGKTVKTNARCRSEEWCVYAVWEGEALAGWLGPGLYGQGMQQGALCLPPGVCVSLLVWQLAREGARTGGGGGQSQLMECWQNSQMNLLGKQHVVVYGCVKRSLSHLGFLVKNCSS